MNEFKPGTDKRRNKSGRPTSAAGLAAKVLKMIGPEITGICDQALMLARAGDPAAISACASLLSAALQFESTKA